MIPQLDDTIVALASAAGAGQRGIVRLSGPDVKPIAASVFAEVPDPWPVRRSLIEGCLDIPGTYSSLPAALYYAPAPRTYTGQETIELHTISCPPLLDALISALMNVGARAAQPGEFTLRAFLNGKKDLLQAEGVLAVIEARSGDELEQALGQLAGGMTEPLHGLRDDLLNLLADIEAGLDFTDEDIQFVDKKDMLLRLAKGLAQLTNLRKKLESRAVSDRPFRVALIGEPNAGKSSLFNALTGLPSSIVSPMPGTTRDYVTRTMNLGEVKIELIDTAGWQQAGDTIEEQAQALGGQQTQMADLLLWCCDATLPAPEPRRDLAGLDVILVVTKADLARSGEGKMATSAKTRMGIDQLEKLLIERAKSFSNSAMASSLSRCRHHVDSCLKHLRAAHAIVLFDHPAELLALELRLALEQLGEMVGAVYTDDLLDRIFSRFCIGK